jgi:hypothetical protein
VTALQNAMHERLSTDAVIASGVTPYRSKPAVFSELPVQGWTDPDAVYIVISPPVNDDPRDSKNTTRAREVMHDVSVYGPQTGDSSLVDTLAERVRDLLHREPLTVSGYGTLIASCTGPIIAPTDDLIYGRIVMVRHMVIKA